MGIQVNPCSFHVQRVPLRRLPKQVSFGEAAVTSSPPQDTQSYNRQYPNESSRLDRNVQANLMNRIKSRAFLNNEERFALRDIVNSNRGILITPEDRENVIKRAMDNIKYFDFNHDAEAYLRGRVEETRWNSAECKIHQEALDYYKKHHCLPDHCPDRSFIHKSSPCSQVPYVLDYSNFTIWEKMLLSHFNGGKLPYEFGYISTSPAAPGKPASLREYLNGPVSTAKSISANSTAHICNNDMKRSIAYKLDVQQREWDLVHKLAFQPDSQLNEEEIKYLIGNALTENTIYYDKMSDDNQDIKTHLPKNEFRSSHFSQEKLNGSNVPYRIKYGNLSPLQLTIMDLVYPRNYWTSGILTPNPNAENPCRKYKDCPVDLAEAKLRNLSSEDRQALKESILLNEKDWTILEKMVERN